MEGHLIVVLNAPESRSELINFARTVFGFPAASLVICTGDPRMKAALNIVHRIAYSDGRSFMSVARFEEAIELFRPERVAYVDASQKGKLNVEGLKEDMNNPARTAALVFGAPVVGERIGLEMNLNSAASAAVVLYEMMRKEYGPVV